MKKFNNIPNRPYTAVEDGKVRFHSRSVAISAIVFLSDGRGNYYVLCHTRGDGCPDERGKWSFNCGYLDWNETLEESVKRELWEELGLDTDLLQVCKIVRDKIDDMITGENAVKQNVTIRHLVACDYDEVQNLLESGILNNRSHERGGEENEVGEIRIFKLSEDINPTEWAFNHSQIYNDFKKHYYG